MTGPLDWVMLQPHPTRQWPATIQIEMNMLQHSPLVAGQLGPLSLLGLGLTSPVRSPGANILFRPLAPP